MSRDGNFVCGLHLTVQSAIGKQQWVTGFHCMWSVVGSLIVHQFGILSLSCIQYSQTICLSGWDDNTCLGVRNTSSIGAWHNSFDWRPPWYCKVSPLLQNKHTDKDHLLYSLAHFSRSTCHIIKKKYGGSRCRGCRCRSRTPTQWVGIAAAQGQ